MKYLAFCEVEEFKNENRSVAPPASSVVKYMADAMSNYENVDVISPSRTLNKSGFYKGRTTRLGEKTELIQPPTFGVRTPLGRIASLIFTSLWLLFYLLFKTKKYEHIVVYHSLSYMKIVKLIKKLKKIRITMEIREIYSDIRNVSQKVKEEEHDYFNLADDYIFATQILNDTINKNNKPYVIASGVYKSEQCYNEKFNDDMIHVIYAGTLSAQKGGVVFAIKMTEFLNENYHVHILGYGSEQDLKNTKAMIEDVKSNSKAQITYDGVLSGEEFLRFLQKCHIGLAVQNMQGEYNNTSFPSKVLTYLSNGLDVLSTDIPAVSGSGVGNEVYYTSSNDAKEIAQCIMQIDVNESKPKKEVLNSLDVELRENIVKMFS